MEENPKETQEQEVPEQLIDAEAQEPAKIEGPVAWEDTIIHERYDDVYTHIQPGVFTQANIQGNQAVFTDESNFELEIKAVQSNIFRVRYSPSLFKESDFSYAIDQDPAGDVSWQSDEKQDAWSLSLAKLNIQIHKEAGRLQINSSEGKTLLSDTIGFKARRSILNGLEEVAIHQQIQADSHYFGLGDKSGPFKLNDCYYENWNTDAFAYGPKSDPLYKTIPFFFVVQGDQYFGVYLDNSYRSFFDFGKAETGVLKYGATGGTLCYYFIQGESPEDVVAQYTKLTGLPELPPHWALGFHQCRWSYYPEARVREVCAEFRKREIPCDAIYLDIDYMDGYRCFTWNLEHFPAPTKMVDDLKADGFQTVVMIDPGLKVDPGYSVFRDGLEKDFFCRRTNGDLLMGPVWPQDCAFPEYTREEVRTWWGQLYRELYNDNNIAGFWNDMNEPAVFKVRHMTFPNEVQHHYEGNPTDHRKAHNIYGLQMARATYEGLKQLKPNKRPFVITRATFSGGQRYSFAWTGDNIASWEHLQLANTQNLRMCISGFSLTGSDIGGFVDLPETDLFVRWLQLGVFHPLFRIHSMGNNEDGASEIDESAVKEQATKDRMDQEPWAFGEETEALAKAAIELRYELLPYIYTCCYELARKGQPVLKPLFFADPTDGKLIEEDLQFLFGHHILAAPVMEANLETQKVYLPKGNWYAYQSNDALPGQQTVEIPVDLSSIPMFVRAGSVIPRYPVVQSTAQLPGKEWYMDIYWEEGISASEVYEDAGEGYGYLEGDFILHQFQQKSTQQTLSIQQEVQGQGQALHNQCNIQVFGLPFEAKSVVIDGTVIDFNLGPNGQLQFSVLTHFHQIEVR